MGTDLWASVEMDKLYRLETIGVLKSWDNVDGLFADYVASAFSEYFAHQSRFVLNDLSKTEMLFMESKLPYRKIIQDEQILGQLARTSHSESLIRTQILKEGSKYFFTLDWLFSPQMELIATQKFVLAEPVEGTSLSVSMVSKGLHENLPKLFEQVPFLGTVTGRDRNSVTLNIGSSAMLKKGDVLKIGTLNEVKKHPLLKRIVDWRFSPTGTVVIEQTEDSIAFGKILEEIPGKEISRFQKIMEVESAPEESPLLSKKETVPHESKEEDSEPKLGWIGMRLSLGTFSRNFSIASPAVSNTGGGFGLGGRAVSEIWLTRQWFANLELGYSTLSLFQSDAVTGNKTPVGQKSGASGSQFMTKIDVGYAFLLSDQLLGPRVWVKGGYKTNAYSLPRQGNPEFTGPANVNSIFLGLGGSMPVQEEWGALAEINLRLMSSVTANWLTETVSSTSDAEILLGATYRLNPKSVVRLTLEYLATGADFSAGSSLSQKTMTFGPTLLYYF